MDFILLINLLCVFVSGYWAIYSFNRGLTSSAWLNLFASALNAAVVASHIF